MDPNILFNRNGDAVTPNKVIEKIKVFRYTDTTSTIINDSSKLDPEGSIFIKCSSLVLSSFGMTRSGVFKKPEDRQKILSECWNQVGDNILKIHKSVLMSSHSRARFLLELSEHQREQLILEIWAINKQILPFTMGKTSYGLVGASKILFSVLPEIVLPIDNSQWLKVFKTVDLGDVIKTMTSDIQRWEKATGAKLNELDSSRRLTTLPSVYNVMAMAARPVKRVARRISL